MGERGTQWQIQALQNENSSLLGRLQTAEQRCHETMLENAQLKEELESLKAQVRRCTPLMCSTMVA